MRTTFSQECCVSPLESNTPLLILSGPTNPVLLSAEPCGWSRRAGMRSHCRLVWLGKLRLLFRVLTTSHWNIKARRNDMSLLLRNAFPGTSLLICLFWFGLAGHISLFFLFLQHSYYLGICRHQFICWVPASIKRRK